MTLSIIESISKMLQEKGVSPSIQRIKILQFILDNEHHSSVDSIYQELLHEIPTLSKTTVYNTLALFVEKKINITVPAYLRTKRLSKPIAMIPPQIAEADG